MRWDSRVVRVFNHRFEQIALHVKHEPGRFSTQSPHIAPQKRCGMGALYRAASNTLVGHRAPDGAQYGGPPEVATMQTDVCRQLDIEFPIFAFTHCRDVVAAVSKAGGFGVLGAVGFPAEQLEVELEWIDEHVGDRPYGVDIVLPTKYEGEGESDVGKLTSQLQDMIPEEHRTFVKKVLADHGVPELPDDTPDQGSGLLGWTSATAQPQVDVAMAHDNVRLLANALGTPPPDIVDQVHDSGRLVAALCGTPAQAGRHKAAGLDMVIAQGYEAGGHTGDVGSMVLWPQVIDEIAPLPMLAAGGIGNGRQMAAALAMGAQGVWTGSLWLTVEEAATSPASMEAYLEARENRQAKAL